MKIVRFLSEENEILYGIVDSTENLYAKLIKGSIFDKFTVITLEKKIKKLLAPVSPPNILALGLNYKKHADETGIRYPEIPIVFLKATNSIIGPKEPIILPQAGPNEVDYEGELAIIIKKKAKNISIDEAKEYILGYTCANDISARDWQIRKQKKQWARGKSFDTFCPIGPCITTQDEIKDADNLRIQTRVNGDILQNSNTSDMIFNVAYTVSNLSQSMTLLPETLILTGTPEGVGFTRKPPVFLKNGDTVSITIEGIGELSNPVINEFVEP